MKRWSEWKRNLCTLKSICVPRCLKPQFVIFKMQLHAFSDASEKAYGCVVYARFISVGHQIVCRLGIAKARVAQLKAVTIPRLELTTAALAVRLTEKVRSGCRLHWDSIHF